MIHATNTLQYLVDTGTILMNTGVPERTLYFKFLGSYYCDNPHRVYRYSLDNPKWVGHSDSTFTKVFLVLTGKAHRLKEKTCNRP